MNEPKRRKSAVDDRRRIGRAVATWGGMTLSGVVLLTAFVLWHLVRRGRLLRDRLGPPRVVQLPEWADKDQSLRNESLNQ